MTATQQSAETAHTTRHATFSTSLIAPTGGVRAVRLMASTFVGASQRVKKTMQL